VAQATVTIFLILVFVGMHYLLAWITPEPRYEEFIARLPQWGVLSAVSLFVISVAADVFVELSRSVRRELQGARLNWLSNIDVMSSAAGLLTLFVAYTLLTRAEATGNVIAKTMIYLAAIGLVFEVSVMAYTRIKSRVTSQPMNQQVEGTS
jgi:hypothetical protein